MKKIFLGLFLSLTCISFCSSQTIEAEKSWGSYRYTQNGKTLTAGELRNQMNTNEESANLMKKAQVNKTFATIFGAAGGALIGYPIGTAIGGGDANWTLAGVGAGLVAVAIPFSIGANKRSKEAIDIYNYRINTKEDLALQPQLHIISSPTGIGFALQF